MILSGVFAPVPTPFTADDAIDAAALKTALTRWCSTPLTGFVVLGSNGEAAFIDDDDAARAIAAAREAIPRARTFIAGTGRESTALTIRACRRAAELGADAVLVRTPGFFKSQMTVDAFVRHYRAVADASPVPVLLYNFTAVTGVDLPTAAVSQLAAHPNIVGMKESNADIAKIGDLASGTPDDFKLFAGGAGTFYAALCAGCVGGILALSCVVPDACVKLYELTTAGRHAEARALQSELVPLARLLGPVYGVAGLKAALKLLGFELGVPRSPLAPLTDAAVAALRDQLAALHVEQHA
jgi:4-hydroxy-2-oxoglutarate aldolase